jgi:hypothetical protein
MTLRWVANSGLDAATGDSMFTPWQTAAKVVASAVTGDRVKLKRGDVWRDAALAALATAFTVEDYGVGDRPVMDGFDNVPSTTWTSTTPAQTWSIAWTPAAGNVTAVDVNGLLYRKAASQAALTPGFFFWAANVLYVCLVGGGADMAAAGFLIEANGNRGTGFLPGFTKGGYLLRNIDFRGWMNGGAVFSSQTSASTVIGCRFRHCSVTTTASALYFQDGNLSGWTVLNCDWDENLGADHMHMTDAPNGLVAYCNFSKVWSTPSDAIQFSTGAGGGSGGWECHHLYIFMQQNSDSSKGGLIWGGAQTVQSANVHDCIMDGGGYMASFGGVTDTTLNNFTFRALLHFNCTSGASVGSFGNGGPSDNSQWIDCISINAASPAWLFFNGVDHTHILIAHCTAYGFGLRGLSMGIGTDRISGTIKNTIWWGPTATSDILRFGDGVPSQALVSDYNIIGPNKTNGIRFNGTLYNSLAAYSTATGQDAHSWATDPMLVDPSTRTPRAGESMDAFIARAMRAADLDPSSWAIGRGLLIAGVNDSFNGPAPDIGAREWQSKVLN